MKRADKTWVPLEARGDPQVTPLTRAGARVVERQRGVVVVECGRNMTVNTHQVSIVIYIAFFSGPRGVLSAACGELKDSGVQRAGAARRLAVAVGSQPSANSKK